MAADTDVPVHGVEVVRILHIDPRRIGMAAGQQLLWRLQNPWSETTHLLTPAKELQGASPLGGSRRAQTTALRKVASIAPAG